VNNFSFWIRTAGAVIVVIWLFVGKFVRTGWIACTLVFGAAYVNGVGVDCHICGLQGPGIGTTQSGINLIATVVKMPIFTWTSLCVPIV
ncbi:hypothetical protein CONLIGDRAFT_544323, partial [Coniochaeta ligniaria NRRL 30616]